MDSEKVERPSPLRSRTSGALVYRDYRDNFVIWPGTEADVERFVNQTYGGQRHKLRHTRSSNSEDALTWSCFATLNCLPLTQKAKALAAIWALAFDHRPLPAGLLEGQVCIGKKYGEKGEETEVDASIEGKGVLVFIEAKLYSPMSLADKANRKLHDQIARKLRVGVKETMDSGRDSRRRVQAAQQRQSQPSEGRGNRLLPGRIGRGNCRAGVQPSSRYEVFVRRQQQTTSAQLHLAVRAWKVLSSEVGPDGMEGRRCKGKDHGHRIWRRPRVTMTPNRAVHRTPSFLRVS